MKPLKLCSLALLLSCACAQAESISVSPLSQTVNAGAQFIVSLQISGLGAGAAPSVGTFDIDLGFNPLVLSFVGATYGPGLDVLGLGSLRNTTPGAGTVNLFELSFDSVGDLNALQPASFLLATLTFKALSIGTSPLSLNVNALGDADGAAIAAALNDGSVTVTSSPSAVPEPSTLY